MANREALRLNQGVMDSQHILLGLLVECGGVAGNVLVHLGVDLPKAREAVERLSPPGAREERRDPPAASAAAKQLVVDAMDEARGLGHNYVGTEHLLLGLLRGQQGVAAEVLESFGLEIGGVRQEVLNLLGHGL